MDKQRWQDWVTALAGAWILLTPWLIPTVSSGTLEGMAFWGQIVVGAVVLVMGIAAFFAYRVWEEWVEFALGLVTISLPWVFGYSTLTALTVSNVIAGIVVAVLSGWMALSDLERAA